MNNKGDIYTLYSRSCAYLNSNLLHLLYKYNITFRIYYILYQWTSSNLIYIYITRKYYLKELFKNYILGVHGTVSSSEIRVTLSVFNFFDSSGPYERPYGVTARSTSNVKCAFGPHRYNIKSTASTTGVDTYTAFKSWRSFWGPPM